MPRHLSSAGRIRLGVLTAFAVSLGMTVHPAGRQAPFRAAADVRRLDVAVVGPDRRPVRGLTIADFEVLEDGVLQPITAFSAIDSVKSTWADDPARAVPQDVSTNVGDDAREFVIVMDDVLTTPDPRVGAAARQIAHGVVDRLVSGDRAALVFTSGRVGEGYSSDAVRLTRAIDTFAPSAIVEPVTRVVVDPTAAVASVTTLSRVVDVMARNAGPRRVLVLISQGPPLDLLALQPGPEEEIANRQWRGLVRQAAAANIVIYTFDPTGIDSIKSGILSADATIAATPFAGRPDPAAASATGRKFARFQRDLLTAMAEETGGAARVGTDSYDEGLRVMFEELSTHYVLGVRAARNEREKPLTVRVRRPGLTVRAAGEPARASDQASGGNVSADADLEQLLRAPVPGSGVVLQLAAAAFASPEGRPRPAEIALVLGVDLPLDPARPSDAERGDLLLRVYDVNGTSRGSKTVTVDLALRPGGSSRLHYEVLTGLALPPGRYELRAAFRSRYLARAGSVFRVIDVPDFESAAASDLVLATTPALHGGPPDAFARLIPVRPTVSRSFPSSMQVEAFVRLYGRAGTTSPASVRLLVLDGEGRAVVEESLDSTAVRIDGRGNADVRVNVPVAKLLPGAYVLKLEVKAGDDEIVRSTRFAID